MANHSSPTTAVRTLLISDVHLGSKHSQAARCLEFLQSYTPEQVYLVGDFIDGWRCNQGWHWSGACKEMIDHIESLIAQGTEVFYVPGNHDSFLRNEQSLGMIPDQFSDIHFANEFVFESLGGWRFLITHGDLFDVVETQAQWVSKVTSFAYDTVLSANRLFNRLTGRRHKNPYGACATLKSFVKRIVMWLSGFESAIMQHACEQNCDGVVCGHTHTPAIVYSDDMLYLNTGDWVENCTGLVEHLDGSLCLESNYGSPRMLQLPVHPRKVSKSVGQRTEIATH
ncbi:UDP-2,3-diacylglucosamine diphosphatase [Allorhodopirellula heiligendammensis]|uniref:UDP-2,3-diacylglucosamine hydrolase n=1 Tax=Allorhodopirellula heiligendammensis TaxID=2714739 RepID=A0A5C6BYM1_9BACT|nr:UDP-2,3-diacylglucosamine diphosphatase [Allorhodopirellula heiligendammensis]TWU15719.1 UDP-2,3-diacylglucosamine hydrolase [Allorhodopirellula heiligendammensis]|tara:strand:+ start:3042 stop:3890 length:849 start_codon:yes stop_codon:yes gene_type:complete